MYSETEKTSPIELASVDVESEAYSAISQKPHNKENLREEAEQVFGSVGATRLRSEVLKFKDDFEADPNLNEVWDNFEDVVSTLARYDHINRATWLIQNNEDSYLEFVFTTHKGQETEEDESTLTYRVFSMQKNAYENYRQGLITDFGEPLVTQNTSQEYFVMEGEVHKEYEGVTPQVILSEYRFFLDKSTNTLMAEFSGQLYNFAEIVSKSSEVYAQIPGIISALSEGKTYILYSVDAVSAGTAKKLWLKEGAQVPIITALENGKASNILFPNKTPEEIEPILNNLGVALNKDNPEATGGKTDKSLEDILGLVNSENATQTENTAGQDSTEQSSVPDFTENTNLTELRDNIGDFTLYNPLYQDLLLDNNEYLVPNPDISGQAVYPLEKPNKPIYVDGIYYVPGAKLYFLQEFLGIEVEDETGFKVDTKAIKQERSALGLKQESVLGNVEAEEQGQKEKRMSGTIIITEDVSVDRSNAATLVETTAYNLYKDDSLEEQVVSHFDIEQQKAQISQVYLAEDVVMISDLVDVQGAEPEQASTFFKSLRHDTQVSADHNNANVQDETRGANVVVTTTETPQVEVIGGEQAKSLQSGEAEIVVSKKGLQWVEGFVSEGVDIWEGIQIGVNDETDEQVLTEDTTGSSMVYESEEESVALEMQVSKSFTWPKSMSAVEAYAIKFRVEEKAKTEVTEITSKDGLLIAITSSGKFIKLR